MKKAILFCLTAWVLCTPFLAFAQEEEEEGKTKLVLSGAYGMFGSTIYNDVILTQDMVNGLGYGPYTDGLSLSAQDRAWNIQMYSPRMPSDHQSTHVNLGIELSPVSKNPNKLNAGLRIGFQYVKNNMFLNANYYDFELLGRTIKDTIVYIGSKDTVILYNDSTRSHSRNIRYTNNLFALDASYIIRTNPSRTFSFTGGFGFSPGLIINSNSTLTGVDLIRAGINSSGKDIALTRMNKMGINLHFYLPLGVNLHISKKHDFWKNVYLVSEIRPSMSIQMLSDIGTHTRFFSQNMVGIRAVFN